MNVNEDNQPCKKRRLEDDAGSEVPLHEGTDAVQKGAIWFDDGSIILQAGQIQFRVHASLLSRCSSVFKDMLSLPQPSSSGSEAIPDGFPVVHLHDSPEDLSCLLSAIYDTPYTKNLNSPNSPMDFSMVSTLLRLGNKYDITHLRDHAISRLKLQYPSTYHEDLFTSQGNGYINTRPSRTFDMACLAYEEGVYSVLPLILYNIICDYETKVILDGKTRAKGAQLPSPLINACILGKEKLAAFMYTDSYIYLKQQPTKFYCEHPPICLEVSRRVMERILQPAPQFRYALQRSWISVIFMTSRLNINRRFCSTCSARLSQQHEQGRKAVWDALPGIFGFESWENVTRMDRNSI